MFRFRWNSWNLDKVAGHGVSPAGVQYVVNHARAPYPQYQGDGKWGVWGQTEAGVYLQVVYLIDANGELFIIHARPLTDAEKSRYRRRRR